MPDGAQPGAPVPAEGQGTEGQDALYADVLDGIPPEHHQTLTERIKTREADLNKSHQSKMEGWKPYDEMGIRDYDPQGLGDWLQQGVALQAAAEGDPQAIAQVQEWLGQIQSSLGLENGQPDESGTEESLFDLSPQKLEEMVGERVAQAVNPVMERMEQQEQQRLLGEAQQEVSDQLSQLRKDHPNLTDDDEKYILGLAWQFGQEAEDPISVGFSEFQKLIARGENGLFEQKLGQPAPAEGAGRPNTTPPEITSENVMEFAKQRMNQAVGT